jgi:hypothetical protein
MIRRGKLPIYMDEFDSALSEQKRNRHITYPAIANTVRDQSLQSPTTRMQGI